MKYFRLWISAIFHLPAPNWMSRRIICSGARRQSGCSLPNCSDAKCILLCWSSGFADCFQTRLCPERLRGLPVTFLSHHLLFPGWGAVLVELGGHFDFEEEPEVTWPRTQHVRWARHAICFYNSAFLLDDTQRWHWLCLLSSLIETLTREDLQNCFRKCQEQWDEHVQSKGGTFWEELMATCPLIQ